MMDSLNIARRGVSHIDTLCPGAEQMPEFA
jgi:hypothetical protein